MDHPSAPLYNNSSATSIGNNLSRWWSQRRDRRRRELLEQQVADQRQKLVEAESSFSTQLNDDGSASLISKSGDGMSVQLAVNPEQEEPQPSNYWDMDYNVTIQEEPKTKHAFCQYILNDKLQSQIAQRVLPPSVALAKWKRLYSLARDGDAFDAFLRKVADEPHTLLIVRTTKNHIFGGYTDSAWAAKHQGNPEFYGSATACLWRIVDNDDHNDNSKTSTTTLDVYKWTGLNRYIQYVDYQKQLLAFGGGGGSFGLCVEREFQRGSTGKCDTFGNDPLCPDENFEILDVECFGFLLGELSY